MDRVPPLAYLGAVLSFLLGAPAAPGPTVHEIVPGGDTVAGSIDAPAEVDRVPVRLVEGEVFSVTLRAARGSLLLPDLVILGTDRRPDADAAAHLRVGARGRVLTVRRLRVPSTGMRWLEIRGAGGTTGGWFLSTKVKFPRGATGSVHVGAGPGAAFRFPAPGNAVANLAAAAARGSPARPAFGGIVDPAGEALFVDSVLPGRTGFSIRRLALPRPGDHVLSLLPGTGGDGPVTVRIRWKVPRPARRALLEAQVITDPVATAVSPPGGNTAQTVAVEVAVDFARPGAMVRFRMPPIVVTAQGARLSVGPAGISFAQPLASFRDGVYDVEVENPDGGRSLLAGAFTVVNAPPILTGVSPAFGYDDRDAFPIDVAGSFISAGATATLVRGADTIPGTGPTAAPWGLTARFDLRGRELGPWDVVVGNPGAAPTALAGAFEIRNAPPVVDSMSPADNLDADVVDCAIDGSAFDDPPGTALRRSGQPDIPGTSVVRVSGERITCTFDTAGRAPGAWDLAVVNPGGGTGTLPGAFTLSGPVAPAASPMSPSGTADGPPSIVWNAALDEFLVGWVEEGAGNFDVRIQRLDSAGNPKGVPVSVPSSAASVPKRDVDLAWDSTGDLYLVSWCEPRSLPSSVAAGHPSFGFYTSVYQVFSRQFRGADLSTAGGAVQVSSHAALAASPGYFMDEFNNYRPSACWDAGSARWQIVWMQEWDVNGTYSNDDWDVFQQTMDPSDGSLLANPLAVAATYAHEGDPCVVYDPVNRGTVAAWNYRTGPSQPLMGFFRGAGSVRTPGVIGGIGDIQDPRLAVDADAGRLLATWTHTSAGGARTVQGGGLHLSDSSSFFGTIVTVGEGNGDHFLARPMYNPALRQCLVSWTRRDGNGGLSVRSRRVVTDLLEGLLPVGREIESSSGSGDEAMPATVWSGASGESVVLWLKTMTFASVNGYPGSALPGTYRGREFWMVRYR